MKLSTKILVAILLLPATNMFAQKPEKDFKSVDEYVKQLGSLDTMNMGTVSYLVTKQFSDKLDKTRAIFDWIAYNISFDCKAARSNDDRKDNSTDIMKYRMATSNGYATLFQDMCSVVKIRCLTVNGYAKRKVEEITEKPDAFNHMWAVVQLGQSAEDWFYVDPAWGSGYTDDKMTVYTKAFNSDYFFADRTIFNYQHFPDNQAWQLGNGPRSKKDFYSLPIVESAAYTFGITRFTPADGHIKTKVKKAVQFSFAVDGNTEISIVAIATGEEKRKKIKTVDYILNNTNVSFSYKFEEEDSFPVTILVNGKAVLTYAVDVDE